MNSTTVRDQLILQGTITGFPVFDPGQQTLQSGLNQFSPIHLDQLGRASLMDRQETKYIFHEEQVFNILPDLETDYRILEIKGLRISNYRTIYFDTAEFLFFQQHHKGTGQRWKIRQRTYLDSHLRYLEVKFKDNRKRTQKIRIQTEQDLDRIPESTSGLSSAKLPCSLAELVPTLEVFYTRSTLVKNENLERITLDSNLSFYNGKTALNLDGLMVAEIKQETYNPKSPFMAQVKTRGIRPSPFSKYCIGISLLNPGIKHNRFKPILHQVNNLLEGDKKHERTQ